MFIGRQLTNVLVLDCMTVPKTVFVEVKWWTKTQRHCAPPASTTWALDDSILQSVTLCMYCRSEAGLWRWCYRLQCSLRECKDSEPRLTGQETSTERMCSINAALTPSAAEVRPKLLVKLCLQHIVRWLGTHYSKLHLQTITLVHA